MVRISIDTVELDLGNALTKVNRALAEVIPSPLESPAREDESRAAKLFQLAEYIRAAQGIARDIEGK